jgi:hypothetical protein
MPSQNDASGKKEDYAVEEMTFALEEQLFQAPGIPDGVTLEEVNYLYQLICNHISSLLRRFIERPHS